MTDVYVRRKTGKEPVSYLHPALEAILEPTYGVIVYQEQVMRIPNVLANYSLGEADVLRSAVGKKNQAKIDKELKSFVERSIAAGVEASTAKELAGQIETFGRYGFNKSHSAAYSLVSYHTAWLKVHYPAEFMAALLSSVLDKTDDVVKYISECRELDRQVDRLEEGLEVLPPDVSESGWKFTVTDRGKIRFGLGAVKGVGSGAVTSILTAREAGPFESFFDFLERVDLRALNKRATEALIAAGALDAFGHRAQLLAGLDSAYGEVQARQAEAAAGQASLFGGDAPVEHITPALPTVPEWDEGERLAREKEALGFFISGHPLERFREVVRAFDRVHSRSLTEHLGESINIAGVVTSVSRQISRRDNSEWGKVMIEDFHGTATVLAFRDAWQAYKDVLSQDAVVLVSGKISGRERDEEDPPIFLDRAVLLDEEAHSGRIAVQIEISFEGDFGKKDLERARAVLAAHPGPAPVLIQLGTDNGEAAPRFRSRSLRAEPDSEMIEKLEAVFGKGRVRLVCREEAIDP